MSTFHLEAEGINPLKQCLDQVSQKVGCCGALWQEGGLQKLFPRHSHEIILGLQLPCCQVEPLMWKFGHNDALCHINFGWGVPQGYYRTLSLRCLMPWCPEQACHWKIQVHEDIQEIPKMPDLVLYKWKMTLQSLLLQQHIKIAAWLDAPLHALVPLI